MVVDGKSFWDCLKNPVATRTILYHMSPLQLSLYHFMNPARFKSKLSNLISHVELINRTRMPSRQPAEQNIPTSWPVKDFGVQDTFIKTCRRKVERIAEDDLFVDGQFMSEQDMVSENMKEYLRLNSSKPGPSYQLKLTNIVKIKLLTYSTHAETKNNHVSKTQFMLLQIRLHMITGWSDVWI